MLRFACATAFLFVAALALPTAAEDQKDEKGVVLKTVLDVTYDFDKDKKKLTVNAVGQVPTGGWADAKLTRRATTETPKDGIYDFDLTAVRPTGIVPQIVSKVKASDTWENPPADIKGVRVHGMGDGTKTVKFDK